LLGFAQRERQENGCAYLVCARRRLRPRSRPGEGGYRTEEDLVTSQSQGRAAAAVGPSPQERERERERDSGARGVKGRRKGRGNPDPGPVLWF